MKKLEKSACREKSDEALMILYQTGEEIAFEVLFERHAGRVLGFLNSKLQDRELAQDITQQTFFKLHRSRGIYKTRFPFLPWLFTIAKTAMLDALKERSAHKREILTEDYCRHTNPAPAPEPASEESIAVTEYLEKLPALQRDAIALRFFQDFPFKDIAQKLGTSENNARQLVSRGIRRLKTLLSLRMERS